MAHPDFSLEFQRKVAVDFLALAHFFGPPRVFCHISHTSNTKKWARSQKSGPKVARPRVNASPIQPKNALSLKICLLFKALRTALSIPESLSRK